MIRVRDNGIGVETNRIVDDAAAGGGFGLFHVREQLQLLGGSCKVGMPSGGGAVFELWAPMREEAVA